MYENASACLRLGWLCVSSHMPHTHMDAYSGVCGGLFSSILITARFFC